MNGISKYGAVSTKIRGMRSHLLTTEDYTKLVNCSDVHEIASYLKSHPRYCYALEELDPDNMRREQFERLLLHSIFLDYGKVVNFLDIKRKKLIDVYITLYDLRLINNIIRPMFNKYYEPIDLSVYKVMYQKSKNLNFDSIINAKNMDELLEGLKDTIYYEPLAAVGQMVNEPKLFDYETALSRFYFAYYWKQLNKLASPSDKKTLLDTRGFEIDMLNIMWVYRTKQYYDSKNVNYGRFLIPAHYRLKPGQLAMLVSAGSVDEMMQILTGTYYGRFVQDHKAGDLENIYKVQKQKLSDKNRIKYPYSFAVIEAYFNAKNDEVDKIISIAESVRYGYDPKLILNELNIRGAR